MKCSLRVKGSSERFTSPPSSKSLASDNHGSRNSVDAVIPHGKLDELKIPNELHVVKGVKHSYELLATDSTVAARHVEYYARVFGADH